MVALEGAAECLIVFAVPDFFDWLLEDIAQDTLLLVLPCAAMAERRETAGEYVATGGGNRGEGIRTPPAGPGALAKVVDQTLYGCGGTGGIGSARSHL
jgi:hypothetical protein